MTEEIVFKDPVSIPRVVVKVHPVVLFSIIDHFVHRNEGQSRVIGSLLGVRTANAIIVKNCFPVPHVETGDDEVSVGKDFLKSMLSLHEKVNPNEELLGWYATASEETGLINQQSCMIQDFYSRECGDPLHLVVDTALQSNVLGVKAFRSESVNLGELIFAAAFHQVKVELACSEPERISLDLMIKSAQSRFDSSKQLSDSFSIQTEIESMEGSVSKLLQVLEEVSGYVDEVVAGRIPADEKIGSRIASVVSLVPRIKPEMFAKSFRKNVQDLLMVLYLSNLTRTQLAVAASIPTNRK